MVFACQRDAYRRDYDATVVSCVAAAGASGEYDIVLNDTVLFPEGGGQPFDLGTIGGVPVVRVTRAGDKAVHRTRAPLEVGQRVRVEVDWDRRWQHMQQHSAQHLISAIAEFKYGIKTTCWHLGPTISDVEFEGKDLPAGLVAEIEGVCNGHIRNHVPVRTVEVPKEELGEVRSRGIPTDVTGPIRVVIIEGIDENNCCGTHVTNLSELQAIKFLKSEPTRGCTRVHFVAGGRVLSCFASMLAQEAELTRILSCGPDEHATRASSLLKSTRTFQKESKTFLKELAELQGKSLPTENGFGNVHRCEGDLEYAQTLASAAPHCKVLFVTVGGVDGLLKGEGQFMLCGPEDFVKAHGAKVAAAMGGKGGGKGGKFQGKVTDLSGREKAVAALREAVASLAL